LHTPEIGTGMAETCANPGAVGAVILSSVARAAVQGDTEHDKSGESQGEFARVHLRLLIGI
jgi:hypothetical protein